MANAQVKEISSRIQAITNTRKVTKTMELIAAAKMRKAVDIAIAGRPYHTSLLNILNLLIQQSASDSMDDLIRRAVGLSGQDNHHTTLVVISSNRGLCGGYNVNLVKTILHYIESHTEDNIHIVGVGKKALILLNQLNVTIDKAFEKKEEAFNTATYLPLYQYLYELFTHKKTDRLVMAYTEYHSATSQEARVEQILPLQMNQSDGTESHFSSYLFEPELEYITAELLERYIEDRIHYGVVESWASEHSARMIAMKNASDAADDMKQELNRVYHRARQAGITQELTEIIAGAEAVT